MADLRITELAALAGGDLAAGDLLAIADISASETKKITVTDLVGNATTLIADATIPGAKILFSSNTIAGSALQDGTVDTTQLADDGVTAGKLADESTVDLVTTLPASGAFVGQIALDTDDSKIYCWNGTSWVSIKAAGSINTVVGSGSGVVNISVSTSGDEVTISTTLDNTGAAAQFLAGPTGAAGAVAYRTIAGGDLPAATTTTKGAVIVNGNGLTMSGETVQIDNTVTANSSTYQVVQYSAKGLVTDGRDITAADLPASTAGAIGAVSPGSGLSVDVAGTLNHTNTITPGNYTKVTVDAQGHVSAGTTLADTDIPDIPASKITSGTFTAGLYGTNSITGGKLANFATVKFGGAGSTEGIVTFPTADYTGQMFFDSTNGDLYLFDGNTYQPVTVISGDLVYAGTYDASTNLVKSTTTQGSAAGFTAGAALPAASETNVRFYVVVSDSGTGVAPAPAVALAPPDMLVSNGATYDLVDVSNAIAGQTASNISFTPYGNLAANNVQVALQELDDEKLAKTGGTITGELLIGSGGSFKFEGSTADDYELEIAAVDPTADRTVTIPNQSGNFLISGNASIVNADIATNASIAYSKLAALTSGNIIIGNGSNVATSVAMTGDVTISNAGVASISTGVIVNADVNASAAIAFSKLANVSATDKLLGRSSAGAGAIEEVICTAAGRALLDDADAAAQRTTLGVVIGTDVQAYDADTAKTDVAQTFTAGQRAEITTLTDGANVSLDLALSNNYTVTLGGNRTLDNPSNVVAGQSGSIFVVQDATGSRTLAYGSDYEFAGGTAPTLSTAANAVDRIDYIVRASGSIHCVFTANYS